MRGDLVLVLRWLGAGVSILLSTGLSVGVLVLFVCWHDLVSPFMRRLRSRFSGDTADAEPYPD